MEPSNTYPTCPQSLHQRQYTFAQLQCHIEYCGIVFLKEEKEKLIFYCFLRHLVGLIFSKVHYRIHFNIIIVKIISACYDRRCMNKIYTLLSNNIAFPRRENTSFVFFWVIQIISYNCPKCSSEKCVHHKPCINELYEACASSVRLLYFADNCFCDAILHGTF